jgi:hypothetical protein
MFGGLYESSRETFSNSDSLGVAFDSIPSLSTIACFSIVKGIEPAHFFRNRLDYSFLCSDKGLIRSGLLEE